MENCWNIIEVLPILVNVEKSLTGECYIVFVPPMKMKYETAQRLGDNLKLSDKDWDYRESVGCDNSMRKFQNDVCFRTYSYKNGSATFIASTIEDVKNWLEYYKSIVYTNDKL